jgi:hypothetical protein
MKNVPHHMTEFLKLFRKDENPKEHLKKPEPSIAKKAKIKPSSRLSKKSKKSV